MLEFSYKYTINSLYKNDIEFCLRFRLKNELVIEFKNLITGYRNNFCYIQKLYKNANNKTTKLKSYNSNKKS